MEPKPSSGEKPLTIRRGRVDSVDLYEIKENELELLENGSPGGIYLNFAIFLLSTAIAAIMALCTATFMYRKAETGFMIVSIVGVIGGVLLLVLWWRSHQSVSALIKKIRNRIPPTEEGSRPEVDPKSPKQPTEST